MGLVEGAKGRVGGRRKQQVKRAGTEVEWGGWRQYRHLHS